MNAKKYLAEKGIYALDTKKRMNEVVEWMNGYAELRLSKSMLPSRTSLIDIINTVVDEHQTLGADNIADAILEAFEPKQVTDEEIKAEAYEDNAEIDGDGFPILKYAYCDKEADAFFEGAKWMRNQMGGGK